MPRPITKTGVSGCLSVEEQVQNCPRHRIWISSIHPVCRNPLRLCKRGYFPQAETDGFPHTMKKLLFHTEKASAAHVHALQKASYIKSESIHKRNVHLVQHLFSF